MQSENFTWEERKDYAWAVVWLIGFSLTLQQVRISNANKALALKHSA
jgi:hypothetical protein